MEKNKTLVDQLRYMVESTLGDWEYPTESKACKEVFGRTCGSVYDEREIFNIIANRIEREYLPRPRYEDGELVKLGGTYVTPDGGIAYVNEICLYDLCAMADGHERLKRPQPEVLDADGVLIHVGDTVWCKDRVFNDDCMCEVVNVGRDGTVTIERSLGGARAVATPSSNLTHKQPDSLERIEADARKDAYGYWGCSVATTCSDCPAEVDGKKPDERYNVNGCMKAMPLDLLRRQRDVLERGQE